MGKNSVTTLFSDAEAKSQLSDFASGLDRYFLADRETGEHWILGSWKHEILPLLASTSEHALGKKLCLMLDQLLRDPRLSDNNKLNLLLYHVSTFYYLKMQGNFHSDLLIDCEKSIVDFILSTRRSLNVSINPNVDGAIKLIQQRGGLLSLIPK